MRIEVDTTGEASAEDGTLTIVFTPGFDLDYELYRNGLEPVFTPDESEE